MANALYVARFLDYRGKWATSKAKCDSDGDAKNFFNAMADISGARWKTLHKRREIVGEGVDIGGLVGFDNWKKAPVAGSSIQVKGKLVWNTDKARKTISIEIPAVKSTVCNPTNENNTTDPLEADAKAALRTQGEGVATTFRQARYNQRLRDRV